MSIPMPRLSETDKGERRPHLPALSYLDVDKAKEDEEKHQTRKTGTPSSHAIAVDPSPTGPPPPYSHVRQGGSWPAVKSDAQAVPEKRKAEVEERDQSRQFLTSLPSISEALHFDKASYPQASPATHQSHSAQHALQSAPDSSPRLEIQSSGGTELPGPPPPPPPPPVRDGYHGSGYRSSHYRQESYPSVAHPQAEPHRLGGPSSHEQRVPPPPQALQSCATPSKSATYQPTSASQYEPQSSQHAAIGPPPSRPYGFASYQSGYNPHDTSQGQSEGPVYQPSAQYGVPPPPSSAWRSDREARFRPEERSPVAYSESIKRHLDMYDVEASLNQVDESSRNLTDFARRYGERMHQYTRTEPTLATLPSMIEIEDMINKTKVQLESLTKIREVIIAQQTAHDQQLAEQRQQQQQQKAFAEQAPPPPPPATALAELHPEPLEETRGGFANGEAKKRRGRAAPPGRCHSCNRAETPEWRRGPDGARTLCNACGLHYAKITRKQSSVNKAANATSSNLRPKE